MPVTESASSAGRHQPGAPMSRDATTTSANDATTKPSRGSSAAYSTSATASTTGDQRARDGAGSVGAARALNRPPSARAGLAAPATTNSHTPRASNASPEPCGTTPGPGVARVSSG